MKAIQYKAFGSSDVLQLTQIDKPTIQESEVLIKIAATTINPLEMKNARINWLYGHFSLTDTLKKPSYFTNFSRPMICFPEIILQIYNPFRNELTFKLIFCPDSTS